MANTRFLKGTSNEEKPPSELDRNKSPLPRARSSLQLLSETATIIENSSAPRDPTPPPLVDASPSLAARITPPTETNYLSENLKLPEMVSTTGKSKQPLQPRKEMVHHPGAQPSDPTATLYLPTLAASSREIYTTTNTSFGSTMLSSSFVSQQGADPVHEKLFLRQQLAVRDATIATLQTQVHQLQQEIRQLRQLPTGKISQIPVEDMLDLMRTYGSEVSDMAMPPRKSYVQKASVVRQFRRWNPNFLDWFEHVNGQWVPKLGRDGELQRRQQARQHAAAARRVKNSSSKQRQTTTTAIAMKQENNN